METSESFSLELLTTYKESSRLEVKSARGGLPNSLWESYSAFANSEGGVDRTVLTLAFEGNQPDIEAMKQLYGNPDDLIEVSDTQESSPEVKGSTQESIQETLSSPESKGESIQENTGSTQESIQETLSSPESKGESIQENTSSIQESIQEIKSNRDKVLYILSRESSITLDEVAKMIGLSRIGVQKIADKLRAEGILSRKGSTKAGEWIVNDKN